MAPERRTEIQRRRRERHTASSDAERHREAQREVAATQGAKKRRGKKVPKKGEKEKNGTT